ncbi:uncharacterized protein MELLADRAFT_102924 [Melampsora larici-populina 98AG31]|uniref:Uncharacterized protein n=1 Tax=Melampsora larici-populina (strain 98AG31 / pathotype 3-4-7) TaxID=747676 RepID=F4R8L8_MELLP|nr:uncharacterized protein MELLADRAFT_102924 [Melampsora larici-populina 98AG31]EGG11089.1 hypothetical protein MELLADRAFT_102924 [Melampsora larici-populina 98AG31]
MSFRPCGCRQPKPSFLSCLSIQNKTKACADGEELISTRQMESSDLQAILQDKGTRKRYLPLVQNGVEITLEFTKVCEYYHKMGSDGQTWRTPEFQPTMKTRSSKSTSTIQESHMNSPVVKAEPSTPKEVLVSRKRPSTGTSYQPDNDGHQHVGNRPRLSSPTSNFQARLDRLQKKVKDLADSVKECAEQAEELEVARTVLEEKLVDDEEKSSKLATKQIQRELRKEIIPNITSLNEQIATLKGDLSNRLDLGRQVKEIQEQLQILEGRIAHEHAPPELSAKQMEEICQYIKQKISSLANDKTLNVKQSATPAAGKVSLDMGKACEIRGALQNMHKTFDEMIQHVLQSEEGGHGVNN